MRIGSRSRCASDHSRRSGPRPRWCATAAPAFDRSLDALLEEGELESAEPVDGAGIALDEATLLPPVGRPGKIVCIGQNYHAHAEEQGKEAPKLPTFFAKFRNAGGARRDGQAARVEPRRL